MSVIGFGRSMCGDLACAERREWLVTNGLGGFASGTVAGTLTRRYHGLLFAATPRGRTLHVAKIEEVAAYDGVLYELATNRWMSGAIAPSGYRLIERFELRGTSPVWRYALADALLEKTLWMEHGANATYVRYAHVRGSGPLELTFKVLVNFRDLHGLERAADRRFEVAPAAGGLRVVAFPGAAPTFVTSDRATVLPAGDWYRDYELTVEAERGLDHVEDHLCAAVARVRLQPGETCSLVATDHALVTLDPDASFARAHDREAGLVERWRAHSGAGLAPAWVRRCVLAADAFVVTPPGAKDAEARSIVAGYPWFGQWSRDAMIALPGLTLTTGRPDVCARILRTFAAYVDGGMLPNYFPETGEAPQYNTVDAPLWYIEAVAAYVDATGDDTLLRELFGVLEQIVVAYRDGTRYGIGLDAADGLVRAGEPGVQLTWMDAKVGDRVVTPRTGKPVEIAALWYDALRQLARLAPRAERDPQPFSALAERTRTGFERFWNAATEYCYDVLDGPDGNDASLRPNQLFAVSLSYSPLDRAKQRAVVTACARHLLAGPGLRSLDSTDGRYAGRYGGSPASRDGAYHQGTSWVWLLGVFATAHARAFGDPTLALGYLAPLADALLDAGLGTLGELADGDAPFAPRGAIAQAWSVAEALRAWEFVAPLARAASSAKPPI